jgi:hypothetical protein
LANDDNMSLIETTGSNSLSLGTSIQNISMAPLSPAEHGVNKSLTITDGSSRDGPLTLKVIQIRLINALKEKMIYENQLF